jgi:glycosyltransferase involved in cell wall biosynthesis
MKISFVVNPVDIDGGWSPWSERIGGSEEFVVETSLRLKERGHEVAVYHNGRHGIYEGVQYKERTEYLVDSGGGVAVNINYPDLRPLEPTVYWTSLYPEAGHDLSAFRKVLAISNWQIANSGIVHDDIGLLPPGYNSDAIRPGDKIPKTVLYSSSPDRGLENLVRAWPEVIKEHPDAQLILTYGANVDLPNCTCLGSVSSGEMIELYNTTDIWCHPCSGGELYCKSGIEAQAAGCWPVYFPVMALSETVRFGTKSTRPTLAQDLITALYGHPEPPHVIFPDWTFITDSLETTLTKIA